MKKGMFERRVVLKYSLLQLPGLFLFVVFLCVAGHFFPIPGWLVLSLILIWIVKDIVLFPVTWRSYGPSEGPILSMKGEIGIVLERLAPRGYINVRGERWRAELIEGAGSIEEGEKVRIIDVKGLLLLVHPEAGGEKSDS